MGHISIDIFPLQGRNQIIVDVDMLKLIYPINFHSKLRNASTDL